MPNVCRTGQQLEFKNPDPVTQNVKVLCIANAAFNHNLPANSSEIPNNPFKQPEHYPVSIANNIHPWMQAWLVVQSHPYVAVSDEDGKFEIKNLPAGAELEFQVWHETPGAGGLGPPSATDLQATIAGKPAGWKRGRFKMTITPGANDLGEIKLDPARFNK